jgi:hypothetical protein
LKTNKSKKFSGKLSLRSKLIRGATTGPALG